MTASCPSTSVTSELMATYAVGFDLATVEPSDIVT